MCGIHWGLCFVLIDSREIPPGATLKADLCIIGAGPVGIALAREFIGERLDVCLLDGGGLTFDAQTQELAAADNAGHRHFDLGVMRRRQFGGLSNAWNIRINNYTRIGVRHMPLDPIDFEKRDWVRHSGWPFSKAQLDPFYVRAQHVCQAGPFDYTARAWQGNAPPAFAFPGSDLETSMFQFGPSGIFSNQYCAELEMAANIRAYFNANVLELETHGAAQHVTAARVSHVSGQDLRVEAGTFVLATGGVENARLLLASNAVATAGLGNQNDVVGRYFMDHPLVRTGVLYPHQPSGFDRAALYDMRTVRGISVMGKITLTEEVQRREHLLGISGMLFPRRARQQSPAHVALRTFRQMVRNRQVPPDILSRVGDFVTRFHDLARDLYITKIVRPYVYPSLSHGGWLLQEGNDRRYDKFEMLSQIEQTPDPENRVRLSTTRNRIGAQLPRLTNHWSNSDRDSIRRAQAIMARGFAAGGIGRLELEDMDHSVRMSSHHNMGTTRMHEDPKQGVVDPDCEVHGVANLYVAGGSVFPTGGYANPTLTMIALALRLADTLKLRMRSTGKDAAIGLAAVNKSPV